MGAGKLEFLQGTIVASTMDVDVKAGMNRFQWGMQRVPTAGTTAGGGRAGGGGGNAPAVVGATDTTAAGAAGATAAGVVVAAAVVEAVAGKTPLLAPRLWAMRR